MLIIVEGEVTVSRPREGTEDLSEPSGRAITSGSSPLRGQPRAANVTAGPQGVRGLILRGAELHAILEERPKRPWPCSRPWRNGSAPTGTGDPVQARALTVPTEVWTLPGRLRVLRRQRIDRGEEGLASRGRVRKSGSRCRRGCAEARASPRRSSRHLAPALHNGGRLPTHLGPDGSPCPCSQRPSAP